MCNCWIGYLNSVYPDESNNIYLDNYMEVLKQASVNSIAMNKKIPRYFKRFKPIDFLNKRKGVTTLFSYCPLCGAKIDLPNLRKKLINESEKGENK
jgi:hypothetical protein